MLTWSDMCLDPATLAVSRAGQDIRLFRRGFAVLHALMRRPGTVLSKADIEERLYGWREEIESNAIEVQVHHLRQKLGANVIETLRGVGYRLAGSAA